MWRRSNAKADIFRGLRHPNAPLFIAHSEAHFERQLLILPLRSGHYRIRYAIAGGSLHSSSAS
jgi:hypothetical protein